MKRFLLISLVLGLFAGTASAALYQLNAATADDMRLLSFTDNAQLWYIGHGAAGADLLVPPADIYGSTTMILDVGFTGNIAIAPPADGLADATIGLPYTIDLSNYNEGFLLPIANDDGDTWQYRAYVTDGIGLPSFSSWATLAPSTSTGLLVPFSSEFTSTSSVGFIIQWNQSLPANLNKTGDQYATSVVPVPAAVILGVLGLAVAGWKLRRFA